MAQRPEIRKIQQGLNMVGHSPGPIDGWYGGRTGNAANALIKADRATNRTGVRYIQEGLEELGYTPGLVDGVWGPKTRGALHLWHSNNGLPVASAYTDPLLPPVKKVTPFATSTIRQGSAGHVVRNLMLHTSATSTTWWRNLSNERMLQEIRRWHTDPPAAGGRGWRNIGYHYVIFPDGEILHGRRETEVGAGAVGFNSGWIHICMIPVKTITRMGSVEDFYTKPTILATKTLLANIVSRTPIQRVAGHNEVANKLCPGFIVDPDYWLG